jgi:hypothetical protein
VPLPSESLLPSMTLLPADGGDPDNRLIPSLDDIGALLHARTTLEGGGEAGTFTSTTHPTGVQVQTLIDMAVPLVLIQLPATVPTGLYGTVRFAIAHKVAAMVERSYFTEQVAADPSQVEGFEQEYTTAMAALLVAAQDNQPGGVRAYGVPIGTVVASSSPLVTDLLP